MSSTYSNGHQIYSVDMMFAYLNNHPVTPIKVKVSDYWDVLKSNNWGDPVKNQLYSAFDTINYPQKYPKDYQRIMNAQLAYPIIIAQSNNQIVDGIHRLAKAYLNDQKTILAYIFNDQLMQKFVLAKETKNVWTKIDRMPVYQLISLYYERFHKCSKN